MKTDLRHVALALSLCGAGSWSDTDGNTHPESGLGGGYSVEDAQLDAISNCNKIMETSIATFNGSHVDDGVGGSSDGSCEVVSCEPYVP
jgi:hypothetical protein